MTLDRYNTLQRFWKKWPPIQILMAGYVGYKAGKEEAEDPDEPSEEMDDESMAELVKMFGPLPQRNRIEEVS